QNPPGQTIAVQPGPAHVDHHKALRTHLDQGAQGFQRTLGGNAVHGGLQVGAQCVAEGVLKDLAAPKGTTSSPKTRRAREMVGWLTCSASASACALCGPRRRRSRIAWAWVWAADGMP